MRRLGIHSERMLALIGAVLAVASVIDDENAVLVWRCGSLAHQQFQATRVHRLGIPGRFREEKLQGPGWRLCADYRLRAHQGGECLVAIARQEQSFQVGAEATPLGDIPKEMVKLESIVFQRARCRRTG